MPIFISFIQFTKHRKLQFECVVHHTSNAWHHLIDRLCEIDPKFVSVQLLALSHSIFIRLILSLLKIVIFFFIVRLSLFFPSVCLMCMPFKQRSNAILTWTCFCCWCFCLSSSWKLNWMHLHHVIHVNKNCTLFLSSYRHFNAIECLCVCVCVHFDNFQIDSTDSGNQSHWTPLLKLL